MNKIKYIIVILAAAFMSYGDEHKSAGHEHLSCYQCWEVSFGLGQATIEEKADGHESTGNIWHLHATKGLDNQIFGINYGLSMGVEGFFGDIKDHYHATVGIALFLTEDIHFSIGPSLGYAKHAHEEHHDEGEEEGEEEEHHDEEEGFETEIGWHGEFCFHLGELNGYTVGGFLGYGENDHETCTEYGLSLGKHF